MKIIRQRDLKDCGVCALESIIEHYGGFVSIEQLRIDARVSSNGTTALNLIEASKKYGFDAVGIKLDSLDSSKVILPAIAHLNKSNGLMHYVVIYKITSKYVILMDPAKGKVIMKHDEFLKEWSNILLVFYPKRKIDVFKRNNSILEVFGKILLSEKKLFLMIVLISIFLMLFTIVGSYYFQVMINAISYNYEILSLKVLVVIFGSIIIFKLFFTFWKKYLSNHLNKNIDVIVNSNFLNHLFKLPLDVITSRSYGEILTRVKELSNIKSLFTEIFVENILDFMLMFASVPLLISISGKLFFVLFLSVLLYLLLGVVSSKMIYKKAYQNISLEADFNNALIEDVKMIHSIKNLNLTDFILEHVEEKLVLFLKDNFKVNSFLNKESNLKMGINEIGFFIINTWGFYLVFSGNIEITSLVTFNTLLGLFLNPLTNAIDSLPRYNFLKATFTKINDFFSVDVETMGNVEPLLGNDICINNLTYSYNKYENIIESLSINIESGSLVLLDGKSGSGKSTICKILDKYITDYKGEILIGGENIKDISNATIRKNILYVNQNEELFTGSIKKNIVLDRNVSNEKFQKICKLCCVDEIVDKKPLRYESVISSSNEEISGGEAKRIILARALLKDFEILILDEALSEVDKKTELKIVKNIKEYFVGKTIIYVTHKRLNNIFDKKILLGGKNEIS